MSDITAVIQQPAPIVAALSVGQGPAGPIGPAGTADKHYQHNQSTASATWSIAHMLGKVPSITIIDSAGDEVEGNIIVVDPDHITLSFSAPFSGVAYCN